jgi:hypothetical protein
MRGMGQVGGTYGVDGVGTVRLGVEGSDEGGFVS